MDKSSSVIAALDAGKLPTTQQLSDFTKWFQQSFLPQGEASSLSKPGSLFASDFSDVLTAYNKLAENKNGDNILQEALWHLSQSDVENTEVDIVNSKEAADDVQALRSAVLTMVKTVWSNATSEGSFLFSDFASFARLALADAAEAVENQAGRTKETLRDVEGEVKKGERNATGTKKKSDEQKEYESDPKVKFEQGMDTLKDGGVSVIGAAQDVSAKAEDTYNRTTNRLENAYLKVTQRAQKDPEYRKALNTIFDTINKWLTKSLDTATSKNTSLDTFINDPTPEQHLPKALTLLGTVLSRLAGNAPLDNVLEKFRIVAADIRADPDLRAWVDEFFAHAKKGLGQPGYVGSEEATKTRKQLTHRWRALRDEDSSKGHKWKKDIDELKKEIDVVQDKYAKDADLNRVRDAWSKLATDVENGLVDAAAHGAETGVQAAIDQVSWFWQDLFQVYVPKALDLLKDVPIPRIEYKGDDVEFVLENFDVSAISILPSHLFIRNITDVSIQTATDPAKSHTAVGALTHIHLQAVQLALKDVSFWYKEKNPSIVTPSEVTGLLAFRLPEKGLDVDIKVRLIPATPENAKPGERERRKAFHVIEKVEVQIDEDVDLQITDSNHGVMLAVFKPIWVMRVREALAQTLTERIRTAIESLDATLWDIAERKEVFLDAGLGSGALAAAIWSEFGKFSRLNQAEWRATGTGVVRGDASSQFAIGAEPQILSGDKRGPVGNFSEPLAHKVQRGVDAATEGTISTTDVESAKEDAMDVTEDLANQAKEVVKQGKETVKTFKQTVSHKAEEEKKKEGWKSSAFDLV